MIRQTWCEDGEAVGAYGVGGGWGCGRKGADFTDDTGRDVGGNDQTPDPVF